MKKAHKIFALQLLIALLIFSLLAYGIQKLFNKDSTSIEYVAEANKLNSLRTSSSLILDDLILNNTVTYDPTNGISIKKVLENLQQTNKKKILLLGSSQYVTVNDDWSNDKYLKRVDKLLQDKFKGEVILHNLSLGGMSIPEKKIVLKKALELNNYDAIIVSIGPYDSLKTNIRQSIVELENIQLSSNKNFKVEKEFSAADFSLLSFNNNIENRLEKNIKKYSMFLSNKSAIKLWVEDFFKSSNLNNVPKEPLAWETKGQDLNNRTGWVNLSYKTGEKSLKIKKSDPKTNASWKGYKVDLKEPIKEVKLSSRYKSKDVKGTKLFCLDFKLDFEDGTYKWFYKNLNFKNNTNDWTYVENTFKSNKNIVSITPNVLFYQGVGTLWVDNIEANSVEKTTSKRNNLLINSDIEKAKELKEVYSITFDKNQWQSIYDNSQELMSYINEIVPNETKSFLVIPPAYHSKYTTTYTQNYELEKFLSKLKALSEKFNISYIDASKILNETHFVTYKTGKKKGFVEPLHFDSKGHKILANYLYKNISI